MEVGLTLNPEKCFLKLKEIPFWGVQITENGIQPNPNKVELKQATAWRRTSIVFINDTIQFWIFTKFIKSNSQSESINIKT